MDNLSDLGFIPEDNNELADLGFVSEQAPEPITGPTSSAAEAFGRGALQSGTAGFAEELGAGALAAPTYAASAMQNLVSDQSPENVDQQLLNQGFTGDLQGKKGLLDTYRGLRNVARARQAQVEQERPLESLAGNVAGAVATMPFMPAGAGLKAGKLALQAGKTGKAARLAARLAEAKQIGGLTALEAAGASQADLTKGDVPGLVGDIASGEALVGGVVGGTAAAKKAIQSAGKVAKYVPWAEDVVDAFKSGMKGVDLAAPIRQFEKKLNELGTDIMTFTKSQLKNFGELKDQLKKEADDAGLRFDVSTFFKEYRDKINGLGGYGSNIQADRKSLLKELDVMESQFDDPMFANFSAADDLKGPLRNLGFIGDDSLLKTPEYTSLATEMSTDLSNRLKGYADQAGMPGYGINEKNYSVFKDLEDVMNFGGKYTKKQKANAVGGMRNTFENLGSPGKTGTKARDTIETAFDPAETVTPGLKERVVSTGQELGKNLQLARKVQSPGLIEGTVKGRVFMGGANIAGRAVRSASEYTPEVLTNLAKRAPKFADQINRALGTDTKKRNAIMFGLMQNPEFRQSIGADDQEESE